MNCIWILLLLFCCGNNNGCGNHNHNHCRHYDGCGECNNYNRRNTCEKACETVCETVCDAGCDRTPEPDCGCRRPFPYTSYPVLDHCD